KGYGALISACGENLTAELGCAVRAIDHRGKRLRIETAKGTIVADQVIVTIPSTLIAAERRPRCRKRPKLRAACRSGLPTSYSCRSSAPRNSRKTPACLDKPIRPQPPPISSDRSGGR